MRAQMQFHDGLLQYLRRMTGQPQVASQIGGQVYLELSSFAPSGAISLAPRRLTTRQSFPLHRFARDTQRCVAGALTAKERTKPLISFVKDSVYAAMQRRWAYPEQHTLLLTRRSNSCIPRLPISLLLHTRYCALRFYCFPALLSRFGTMAPSVQQVSANRRSLQPPAQTMTHEGRTARRRWYLAAPISAGVTINYYLCSGNLPFQCTVPVRTRRAVRPYARALQRVGSGAVRTSGVHGIMHGKSTALRSPCLRRQAGRPSPANDNSACRCNIGPNSAHDRLRDKSCSSTDTPRSSSAAMKPWGSLTIKALPLRVVRMHSFPEWSRPPYLIT